MDPEATKMEKRPLIERVRWNGPECWYVADPICGNVIRYFATEAQAKYFVADSDPDAAICPECVVDNPWDGPELLPNLTPNGIGNLKDA